jgi:hypothetical protein
VAKVRNPLEPAASYVHVFLWLTLALVGLGVVATIFGSGSVFGFGGRDACVEMQSGVVPVVTRENNIVLDVKDGVTSGPSAARMCVNDPTVGQRFLQSLTMIPTFVIFNGALLLAAWWIRAAGREGLFAESMARRLRILGWFVLAGEVGATWLEAQARLWLANTMLTAPSNWVTFNDWDLPVLALFLGAVLITMARIMRISTAMREDLEGTV